MDLTNHKIKKQLDEKRGKITKVTGKKWIELINEIDVCDSFQLTYIYLIISYVVLILIISRTFFLIFCYDAGGSWHYFVRD